MGFKSENHDNMELFKNRLWKLMEKKKIDSASKLAEELCKHNLVKVNVRESDEFLSEKHIAQKKIWSTENKIKKHLNSDDTSNLQGEFVTAYCTFFSCSADYLFGNIECSTKEKQICKDLTGLSEDAIDVLIEDSQSYSPIIRSAINFLLEKDTHLNDKRELLYLIINYVLLSQNIKSYDECGVSKMENKNIALRDEYGMAVGSVPINKMSNIFLLSINEILSKLKNDISTEQIRKKPTLFDILDDMLFDLIHMEEIRDNIDGFNFDIDGLSIINRRFEENKKRLVYLFGCTTIHDINFDKFKILYPQYNDDNINLLKETLNF